MMCLSDHVVNPPIYLYMNLFIEIIICMRTNNVLENRLLYLY